MWEVFDTLTGQSVTVTNSAYRARRIVCRPGHEAWDYALAGQYAMNNRHDDWSMPVAPRNSVVRVGA